MSFLSKKDDKYRKHVMFTANNKRNEENFMNPFIRKFVIISIPLSYVAFLIGLYFEGGLTWNYALPLELCNLTEMTMVFAFWKRDKKLLHLASYPGILGGIIALGVRGGSYNINDFFAVYFVFYHAVMLFSGLYSLYLQKFQVKTVHIFKSMAFISCCAILAAVANFITKGNYMYIGKTVILTGPLYYVCLFCATFAAVILVHFATKGFYKLLVWFKRFKHEDKKTQLRQYN